MAHTLAAVFALRDMAERARHDLITAGFPGASIRLHDAGSEDMSTTEDIRRDDNDSLLDSVKHFFTDLFGSHADRHIYAEAVRRGHVVLTLEGASDADIQRATDLVERYAPLDIDAHAEHWRAGGWQGAPHNDSAMRQGASMQSGAPSPQGTSAGNLNDTSASQQFAGGMASPPPSGTGANVRRYPSADNLPGIVSRMDVPMADASVAPTWLLSGVTREKVTVALGGDGADELWAGYEHYIGFKVAEWYNALPALVRHKVVEPLARRLPSSAGYINPRLAVATFLRAAQAPAWQRVQTMLTAFTPDMQAEILTGTFKAQAPGFLSPERLFAPTREQFEHWQPYNAATPLARAFYVYAHQFMLDDILVKVDRCSMLHSLEVRAPFLDKDVAEFAARLPVDRKLHGFKRKWLLKRAFAGLLPREILHRNKRGFQIPVAEWLRGRMRPLMEDLLSPDSLKAQGIFNPATVRALMDEHISGRADLRKPLWTLLVFQLWWQARQRPAA